MEVVRAWVKKLTPSTPLRAKRTQASDDKKVFVGREKLDRRRYEQPETHHTF
jgi:hypothetical protein